MYDVADRWEIATLRRYCKGEICADFEQQVGGGVFAGIRRVRVTRLMRLTSGETAPAGDEQDGRRRG